MQYFIDPQGSPSHILVLTAMVNTGSSVETVGPGHTIEWRLNGAVVKNGLTDDVSNIQINTGLFTDISFYAKDTGGLVDFIIDSATFSFPVVLANQAPSISSAAIVTDAYNRTSRTPTLGWNFDDADDDLQFYFRVQIDTFDTGKVYGWAVDNNDILQPGDPDNNGIVDQFDVDHVASLDGYTTSDPEYERASDLNRDGVIDSTDEALCRSLLGSSYTGTPAYKVTSSTVLAPGASYSWTLTVTDGEKVTPTDPDILGTVRIETTTTAMATANTPPVASNVLIDGLTSPASITSYKPLISWTYVDADGQPQQSYRVKVCKDAFEQSVVWESPMMPGTATSLVFNFNNTALDIDPHTTYYVFVRVWDTWESSAAATATFSISNPPTVKIVTVNAKINPLNLKLALGENLIFTWEVEDLDGFDKDPIKAYELRIGDSTTGLGTDGFVPNVVEKAETTPASFQAICSPEFGCPAGTFVSNTTYYFQVRVYTETEESNWWFGFFRLNNPPTATNVQVVPATPYGNDDLSVSYVFVDDGGEQEGPLTEIKWYKNGVEQTALLNERSVPSSLTTAGDIWYFTVRPHDGTEFATTVFTASTVTILNRPPTVIALGITPSNPRSTDSLCAQITASDLDGDEVIVSIAWFVQLEGSTLAPSEVTSLRNTVCVPPDMLRAGQIWFFTATPNDGFVTGQTSKSSSVTILNTPPEIQVLSIDGDVIPRQLDNPNPVVSWSYVDVDGEPQSAYRVIIGSRPLRAKPSGDQSFVLGLGLEFVGITSVQPYGTGEILSGDDIYDSSSVSSQNKFFQYVTPDFIKEVSLQPQQATVLDGYAANNQGFTLKPKKSKGTVSFAYDQPSSMFQPTLEYPKTAFISRFMLQVNGSTLDAKKSAIGTGPGTITFKPIKIAPGDRISIVGEQVDAASTCSFNRLKLIPTNEFIVKAEEFDKLSGYVSAPDGGVRLAGLAGNATVATLLPSGEYDLEVEYQTEDAGNPAMVISINGTVVDSFTYETGQKIRKRVVQNISISKGDIVKISGTRNGNAMARFKSILFRPKDVSTAGSKLSNGLTYYASVAVFDGTDWSSWYTTLFTMSGSAWATNVSNKTGWTIEAAFRLLEDAEVENS